jgi:hypothetical protein
MTAPGRREPVCWRIDGRGCEVNAPRAAGARRALIGAAHLGGRRASTPPADLLWRRPADSALSPAGRRRRSTRNGAFKRASSPELHPRRIGLRQSSRKVNPAASPRRCQSGGIKKAICVSRSFGPPCATRRWFRRRSAHRPSRPARKAPDRRVQRPFRSRVLRRSSHHPDRPRDAP